MSKSGILIIYTPGTPKNVKQNVRKLTQPQPRYFKERLFSNESCLDLLKYFKLCNFEFFYIHKTQQESPFLLKCVSSISFPCLTQLHLQNVKLSSFQPLQWIEAPHLIKLHLLGNNVVSVKSLAKTKFSSIHQIEIDQIVDHEQMKNLTRMKLKPRTQVSNQSRECFHHQNQNSNKKLTSIIEFMFKIESNNFKAYPKKNIRNVEKLMIRASQRKKDEEGKQREIQQIHQHS